jgi:hypothetical protein
MPKLEPETAKAVHTAQEAARLRAASAVLAALQSLPSVEAYRVLGWCYGRGLHHEATPEARRVAAMNHTDGFEIGRTA